MKMTIMLLLIVLLIAVPFGAVFYGVLVMTGNLALALVASFAVLVLIWVLFRLRTKTPRYKAKQAAAKALEDELQSITSYDKDTKTLVVTKRSPILAKCIQIEKNKNYYVKYEPKKVHIGSATVGGVTTGGMYTTGGYNYVSHTENNGLCELVYGAARLRINSIQLLGYLFEEAKTSNISSYLNDYTKQIVVHEEIKLDRLDKEMLLNNLSTTGYVGNEFANRGAPTLEKAMLIMDWLTEEEK